MKSVGFTAMSTNRNNLISITNFQTKCKYLWCVFLFSLAFSEPHTKLKPFIPLK